MSILKVDTITDQSGKGTFHQKKDLPVNFKGWNVNIKNEIGRLKNNK